MAYFIEKNRFEVIKSTHACHSKHVYAYRCRVIVLERTAYIPTVKLADLVAADLHLYDDDSDAYVSLRGQLHGNKLTFNHFSGGIMFTSSCASRRFLNPKRNSMVDLITTQLQTNMPNVEFAFDLEANANNAIATLYPQLEDYPETDHCPKYGQEPINCRTVLKYLV